MILGHFSNIECLLLVVHGDPLSVRAPGLFFTSLKMPPDGTHRELPPPPRHPDAPRHSEPQPGAHRFAEFLGRSRHRLHRDTAPRGAAPVPSSTVRSDPAAGTSRSSASGQFPPSRAQTILELAADHRHCCLCTVRRATGRAVEGRGIRRHSRHSGKPRAERPVACANAARGHPGRQYRDLYPGTHGRRAGTACILRARSGRAARPACSSPSALIRRQCRCRCRQASSTRCAER